MNKTTEALKLAAKALSGDYAVHPDEALAAIREALAEPVKQEPVAEIKVSYTEIDGESFEVISCELDCGLHKLYAAPDQPVTQEPVAWMDFHGNVKNNEEINDYIAAGWGKDKVATYSIPLYAAPVQPVKQEPVAGVVVRERLPTLVADRDIKQTDQRLYAAPVKREWVDLTDDEVLKSLGANSYDEYSERELANAVLDARAVIAAFKEKNTPKVVPQALLIKEKQNVK